MLWSRVCTVEQLNKCLGGIELFFGFRFTSIKEDSLHGAMEVSEKTLQPAGLLHGGVSSCLAETIGSVAANLCLEDEQFAVGMTMQTNLLRSARLGDKIDFEARPLKVGTSTQVWNIVILTKGELVSQITFTVAVRDKKRLMRLENPSSQ